MVEQAVVEGEKAIDINKVEPFANLVCSMISQSPTEVVVQVRARRFAAQSPTICVHIPSLNVGEYDVQLAKIDEIFQSGVARRLEDGLEMRQVTLIRPIEIGRPLKLRISLTKPAQSLAATVYHLTGGHVIVVPPMPA